MYAQETRWRPQTVKPQRPNLAKRIQAEGPKPLDAPAHGASMTARPDTCVGNADTSLDAALDVGEIRVCLRPTKPRGNRRLDSCWTFTYQGRSLIAHGFDDPTSKHIDAALLFFRMCFELAQTYQAYIARSRPSTTAGRHHRSIACRAHKHLDWLIGPHYTRLLSTPEWIQARLIICPEKHDLCRHGNRVQRARTSG